MNLLLIFEKPMASYYCLTDTKTPPGPKLFVAAVILYFIFPIDLIPDMLMPGLASVDDVLLLAIAWRNLWRYVKAEHITMARSGLGIRSRDAGPKDHREKRDSSGRKNNRMKTAQYYAEVLGLGADRSMPTIKQKYWELAKQYHPDRVQHLGPELRKVADQKMKNLNEAYQFFKSQKG
jgi:uncharacterized membrane protein YkvA (DUF1232 family)